MMLRAGDAVTVRHPFWVFGDESTRSVVHANEVLFIVAVHLLGGQRLDILFVAPDGRQTTLRSLQAVWVKRHLRALT